MDATRMLQVATLLFLIGALGGLVMAAIRFGSRKVNPPTWLAMVHGLLGASGLTLLIYATVAGDGPPSAAVAAVLLVLAALGGVVLNLNYRWKDRLLPAWLVTAHAVLAVAGFALLAFAAFA